MLFPPWRLSLLLLSSTTSFVTAVDISSDTPISELVSSANSLLSQGKPHDALTYFDAAISHDPSNYLAIFKRGATYLSLGKPHLATRDFDQVLTLKPDFEGALLQRAKLRRKSAQWKGARDDFVKAGMRRTSEEIDELDEAKQAADLAVEAAERQDWEMCVSHAGKAISVASASLELRGLRARCRFERGEVREGVSDLAHVLQLSPMSSSSLEATRPHLEISAMLFYSLGDVERGLGQIRKCLHSDPDSKVCGRLYRREKAVEKKMGKVRGLMEKRQFAGAVKLLVPRVVEDGKEDEMGLVGEVKRDVKEWREEEWIHSKAGEELVGQVVELTCEAYTEMNNPKKAQVYCTESLRFNPHSFPALLSRAQSLLSSEDYESAIGVLNTAREHHPEGSASASTSLSKLHQTLYQKAQAGLHQSKQKDYYKVLQVPRDADAATIKRNYRKLTKLYHPDKIARQRQRANQAQNESLKDGNGSSSGIGDEEEEERNEKIVKEEKESAEKKMAAINEAYEVLSNPDLKHQFDLGVDPFGTDGSQNAGGPFHHGSGGGGGAGPIFFQHHHHGGGQGGRGGQHQQQQFFFQHGGGGGGGGGREFRFQFPGGGAGGFPF